MTLDQGLQNYDPTQDPTSPYFLPTNPPPMNNALDAGAVDPVFHGNTKTPGGGFAYPSYEDPVTGSFTSSPETTAPQLVPDSGAPISSDPTAPTAPIDPTAPPPPGAPGDVAPTADGEAPIAPGGPPEVASPSDMSGFTPTSAPSRGRVFGFNQSFATAIPRVSGNGPAGPHNMTGAAPSVPLWARGLVRSPYARFLSRGGTNVLAGLPGFNPDEAPVDDQRRMREQQGEMPVWAQPIAPTT